VAVLPGIGNVLLEQLDGQGVMSIVTAARARIFQLSGASKQMMPNLMVNHRMQSHVHVRSVIGLTAKVEFSVAPHSHTNMSDDQTSGTADTCTF